MQGSQFANPQKNSLGAAPAEGPMVVPVFVDFTAVTSYKLDLTYIQQQGRLSMIQTIYVDNSLNAQPITIITDTVNQSVRIPAYCQAYIPLAVTNKMAITLNSTGAVVVPVHVLNVAMNAAVWVAGQNPPVVSPTGAITVTDTILESGVVGGYYQAEQFEMASGGVLMPQAAGTKLITGVLSATTAATLFTGAPGFQLTNLQVFASPDAILGAAAKITVTAAESTVGNIAQGAAFLPTVAPTGLTGAIPIINIAPKYTSKVTGTNLTLTLSAVPTGGNVYYNAAYSLLPFIGG